MDEITSQVDAQKPSHQKNLTGGEKTLAPTEKDTTQQDKETSESESDIIKAYNEHHNQSDREFLENWNENLNGLLTFVRTYSLDPSTRSRLQLTKNSRQVCCLPPLLRLSLKWGQELRQNPIKQRSQTACSPRSSNRMGPMP